MLTRREFIQQTGLGLLSLGIAPRDYNRYATALAAPIPRKLALLVGINHYGEDIADLQGCLTDVELQRKLLCYRFGFQAADIVTLTGAMATREGIETAFREHLIAQAQEGDVVVFHFSGYGSQIQSSLTPNSFANCLLTSEGTTNPLLEETLILLGRALETDKLTMVLDTSYIPFADPLQGNLRIRSYSTPLTEINPAELAVIEDLRERLAQKGTKNPIIILRAAQKGQIATELSGNGWSAGLFTYSLTQSLWEVPVSLISALTRASEKLETLTGTQQQPQIESTRAIASPPAYHIALENSIGGEAVVTNIIDDKILELTLTGLPPGVIENYGINSCFTSVPTDSKGEITVQILSRQGLQAKAQLLSPFPSLEVGRVFQEKSRVLPSNLGLIVALDRDLSRIERVDATSAFAAIPEVTAVVTVGERRTDCVLSRIETDEAANYGLFSPSGALMLGSLGVENEAVKSGVKRLEPQLDILLALKLWQLTVNEGSSRLAVSVCLEKVTPTPSQIVSRRGTRQALITDNASNNLAADSLVRFPLGSEIRYQIENKEDQPLYGIILGIDLDRDPTLICSCQEIANTPSRKLTPFLIESKKTLIIPHAESFRQKVTKPIGLILNYVLLSRNPLEKTFAILNATQTSQGESAQLLALSKPLEVARALWEDLRIPMALKMDSSSSPLDVYAFDVRTWATLSFIYQVVD